MTTVITRMQEITLEIQETLDNLQNSEMSVGKLLREALDIMKDEGKKQADFLEYCKTEFAIGKSQAYKLMKVSEVFEDDKRFKGVAMRVLYAVATQANADQFEKAAELAANGSLTTAVLNQILNPEPVQQEEPKPEKETPEQAEEKQQAAEESLNTLPEAGDDVPFDMGDNSVDAQMAANDAAQESNAPLNQAELEGKENEIAELRKALKAANELIRELKDSKAKKPTAPMLPQFKNACPYAVLGLGQLESKQITKVKKAYRELIKCGYGDGHEAFALLTKAKDQLLDEIEAAKAAK